MKKIAVILLALALSLTVLPAAFAAEKISVENITVICDLPVQNESPDRQPPEMELLLPSDKPALTEADWGILDEETGWYDDSTGSEKKLGEEDLFVNGRSYLLRVSFKIFKEGVSVDNDTQIYVNRKAATFSVTGSGEDKVYEISCRFVCTPTKITPKVTIEVEGETEKDFDGEKTVLTASVEETDGISYAYQWYLDDEPVKDQTSEKIEIRNVSQSGEYYCKVSAFVTTDGLEASVETDSASQRITIHPIPCVIRIESEEKNLFEKDPSFSYKVEGDIYDELKGEPARVAGEDLGKYAIGVGTLSFDEDKKDNYKLEVVSGYLTILKPDELPFSPVSGTSIADLSYIRGKNSSMVLVSASRGSLPEGALVTLRIPSEDQISPLQTLSSKEIFKSLAVSVVNENGKEVSLPKHATLRIQLPLTEEEEKMVPETITAGFYNGKASLIEPKISRSDDGITYLVLEITGVGTVSLFRGEDIQDPKQTEPDDAQKGPISLVIWILIAVGALLAVGAIVFSIVWTTKNRVKAPALAKKEKKPDQKEIQHRERIQKIADEINAMPPVPEEKKEVEEKEEKPEEKKERKVISFEDLEG